MSPGRCSWEACTAIGRGVPRAFSSPCRLERSCAKSTPTPPLPGESHAVAHDTAPRRGPGEPGPGEPGGGRRPRPGRRWPPAELDVVVSLVCHSSLPRRLAPSGADTPAPALRRATGPLTALWSRPSRRLLCSSCGTAEVADSAASTPRRRARPAARPVWPAAAARRGAAARAHAQRGPSSSPPITAAYAGMATATAAPSWVSAG